MVIFNIDDGFKIENNWEKNTFKCWIVAESAEIKNIPYSFSTECIKECLDYNQQQRIDYYNNYIFIKFIFPYIVLIKKFIILL